MTRENVERSRKVYKAYQGDIVELTRRLVEEIDHHAAYAEKEGFGWWAVGEIAGIRETLVLKLADLAAQSPADIMESLEGTRVRRET